jgi:hypothetical protein
MREPDPVADRFLENRLLSLRHQRVIVEAKEALRGMSSRSAFIRYAARTDGEDAALLFQEMRNSLPNTIDRSLRLSVSILSEHPSRL